MEVNHPSYYNQGPYEVMELVRHFGFVQGNIIKYILRAPHKGQERSDYAKAVVYLDRWDFDKRPYTLLEPETLLEVRKIAKAFGNADVIDLVALFTGYTRLLGGKSQEDFVIQSVRRSLESHASR